MKQTLNEKKINYEFDYETLFESILHLNWISSLFMYHKLERISKSRCEIIQLKSLTAVERTDRNLLR
jgi:hypothetical protein